jgi:hypothetical protein
MLHPQHSGRSVAQGIEQWSIDPSILYAQNPRTHPEAQIAAVIKAFRFNDPI